MKKSIFLVLFILIFTPLLKAQMYYDFKLPDIDGNDVTLSSIFEKADVVMLSFWATWCTPCKEEMKKMSEVYNRYKDKGFEYVALNIDNQKSVSRVKSFISAQGYKFTVLLDTDKKVFEAYSGKDEMPYSILINKKKEILNIHTGFKTGDEKKLESEIKNALSVFNDKD